MTDHDALLAAVKAAPDDDRPRLVYADWLEDRGEHERAEFIRLQIRAWEISTSDMEGHGAEWDECVRRFRQLSRADISDRTKVGGFRWAGWPLNDVNAVGECNFDFIRGFVEEVAGIKAADWLKHGDAITAAHPVRAVRFPAEAWQRMPFPEMVVPASGTASADDPGSWWYYYDAAPDVRFTLKALCDVLGVTPYMALRVNQVWEGYCRLRWPGVAFEFQSFTESDHPRGAGGQFRMNADARREWNEMMFGNPDGLPPADMTHFLPPR